MPKPWVLIDSPLTTRPAAAGTRGMAAALQLADLAGRLGVERTVTLGDDPSVESLVSAVAAQLEAGARPIILGGDCGVALGAAALRRRGRFALAYIDGHTDFTYDGNLEPQPASARSEIATLTGRGRAEAIFQDDDTALIGFRKDDPAFLELKKTAILLWPMFWLYEHARHELDQSLNRRFQRDELDGIWVHLDVDALDPSLMSAVPYPAADGLAGPELTGILRTLLLTGKVSAMSIANLDSSQDPGGRQASLLADLLVEVWRTSFGDQTE